MTGIIAQVIHEYSSAHMCFVRMSLNKGSPFCLVPGRSGHRMMPDGNLIPLLLDEFNFTFRLAHGTVWSKLACTDRDLVKARVLQPERAPCRVKSKVEFTE